MSDVEPPQLARPTLRRRWRRWIGLTLFLLVAGYVLFNCSGLSFPIFRPAPRLQSRLQDDLGMTLPAGVVIECGSRVAYIDPAEGYLLHVPAGTAASFVEQFRARAAARGIKADVEDHPVFGIAPAPDWFRPEDLPHVKELRIWLGDDRHSGYYFFFSPERDAVYVFWFTT